MSKTLEFYNKIQQWILDQYKDSNNECFFIGFNAPQGAGKTTLTHHLVQQFKELGLTALSLSIDDFYLTRESQIQLAENFSNNPYLQQRGYPGTHDLKLGDQILNELQQLGDKKLSVPRYDKSAHSGQGDRFPQEQWGEVQGPIRIVLLEGWMLGFRAPNDDCKDPLWQQIDSFLPSYNSWLTNLDAFIYLKAENPQFVLEWRKEAEQNMRAEGKSGMSDEQVSAYAEKFIPAYSRYADSISEKTFKGPFLKYTIGKNRLPS